MGKFFDDTVAGIMKADPFEYPSSKYNTPQKRLKVLQEALIRLGVITNITVMDRTIDDGGIYKYIYQVQINFEVIKRYKHKSSARNRLAREFIKRMKLYEASKTNDN